MKMNFTTNFTYLKKPLKLHVAALRIDLHFFIQRNDVEEMFFKMKDMVIVLGFKDVVVAREFFVVERQGLLVTHQTVR
jgi:hypothetical protein